MNEITRLTETSQLRLDKQFQMISSFDVSTPEGRVGAFNASQRPASGWEDWLGKAFPVENILVHRVATESLQNGEVVDVSRVVLVSNQGDLLASCSEFVLHAVAKLFAAFGCPPWSPPVLIVPAVEKSRKGLNYFTFYLR
jgi:hypothetical protein